VQYILFNRDKSLPHSQLLESLQSLTLAQSMQREVFPSSPFPSRPSCLVPWEYSSAFHPLSLPVSWQMWVTPFILIHTNWKETKYYRKIKFCQLIINVIYPVPGAQYDIITYTVACAKYIYILSAQWYKACGQCLRNLCPMLYLYTVPQCYATYRYPVLHNLCPVLYIPQKQFILIVDKVFVSHYNIHLSTNDQERFIISVPIKLVKHTMYDNRHLLHDYTTT